MTGPNFTQGEHRVEEILTKAEYVARRVREMVITGELEPAARVRQQEVAELLGVSPTPVREAFKRLVSEGYLTTAPHLGVTVADVHSAGSTEVYELRKMLEGFLARAAADHVTGDLISELKELNEKFRESFSSEDEVTARRFNYQFHLKIWEAADKPVALRVVDLLWAQFPSDLFSYVPGRHERSFREHAAMVQALEEGDADASELALQAHIISGQKDYLKHGSSPVAV